MKVQKSQRGLNMESMKAMHIGISAVAIAYLC